VYQAKLAEQAERYDAMKDYMNKVCAHAQELHDEERTLLSVAYKNASGSRRTARRIMKAQEENELKQGNEENGGVAKDERAIVEKELVDICEEIHALLKDLLQAASNGEAKVFYHKMKADYYWYVAEVFSDDMRTKAIASAREDYEDATKLAEEYLLVTDPIRLGLALNYANFKYEDGDREGDREGACTIAKEAFEKGIAELDNVSEDKYKDSTLIMQLLRDKLTLWTSD
jgi:14-3-3 protein epsilon